jgi:hypothetical protein
MAVDELSLLPVNARLSAEDRQTIMQKAKLYKLLKSGSSQQQEGIESRDDEEQLRNRKEASSRSPNELLLTDLKAHAKNFKKNAQHQSPASKPNIVLINIGEKSPKEGQERKGIPSVGTDAGTWEAEGAVLQKTAPLRSPAKVMEQSQDLLHIVTNASSPSQDQSSAIYKHKKKSQPKQGGTGAGSTVQ